MRSRSRAVALGAAALALTSLAPRVHGAQQPGSTRPPATPQPSSRPNIVLMFGDNIGWGEVGAYGGVRGVPTPQLDGLATAGLRLDNFNVEFSCVVSRVALLTGRYAVRAGADQANGMTL